MTRLARLGGLTAVSFLFGLAACSDDVAAPAEDQEINMDVAQFAADQTTDDILLMTDETDHTMRPGFAARPGCSRGPLKKIRCSARTFAGDLSFTREVTFYDQDGVEMDAFDAQETESIHMVVSIEGERTRDQMTMSVSRDRDFTVSGLFGDETQRVWNGTGSADVNRTRVSDENGDRTYDMSSTTEVTDVIIPVPRDGQWPTSGTITRDVTVEVVVGLDDPQTRSRTVTITFNGTQFVPITVNGEEFTLDLATRTIVENGT
jgi:hypothetical protein